MSTIFFIFYYAVLGASALFGLHRLILALLSLRATCRDPKPLQPWIELPRVTVQLPVFNERFTIRRLLGAVSKLDYPKNLLEIQVLDDSTDDTTAIAREAVTELHLKGLLVNLIHRRNRSGYKAGALANGLKSAHGEFIAVFDADFLPKPDFILRTIHLFTDPCVGMVQVRWGHENPNDSLLTKLQSMLIDGHFMVDQVARYSSGRFFNFNGSAGIWRRQTIEDAGGWHGNTLSEDLDLSYRAQLAGWKFALLTETEALQELPRDMRAFKSQQFRWAKGSLEVARKLLPHVWKARQPLKIKLEATFHLASHAGYTLVLLLSLSTLPVMMMRLAQHGWSAFFIDLPLFIIGTGSLALYFVIFQRRLYRDWPARLLYFPFFIAALAGLSLIHVKALFEVLQHKRTPFIRTPKQGSDRLIPLSVNAGYQIPFDSLIIGEFFMGTYLLGAIGYAVDQHSFGTIPFLVVMGFGYFYVAFKSFPVFRLTTFKESSRCSNLA